MKTMTPLERFKVAAKLGIPDQVPVMPFATGHYIAWFAGLKERDYWWDPVKKFEAQLKLHREFPGVMFYPGIVPDYSIAIESSAFGCKIEWPENASPQIREHIKDIDNLEPPDPWKDGFMPKALQTYKYMQDHLPSKYQQYEYLDGWAGAAGPTETAGLILGYDKFLESLYLDPEKAHEVMKITTETTIRFMKAQEEIGGRLKRFLISDDIIGLISPEHFREFSLPYLKKIFDTFSYAMGIFHCDANTTHLLEDIPEVGMDVFNFGPEIDIEEIKNKIGDRVCLLGNFPPISIKNWPPSRTLQKGTLGDIDRICRHLMEVGKSNGGYMLTTGSGMARSTPKENIEVMIRSAEKYGKY